MLVTNFSLHFNEQEQSEFDYLQSFISESSSPYDLEEETRYYYVSTKLSATLEQPIGQEIAKQRQAKLQQNSQNNDVRLLFSIVLSDSSHDVLIAKDRSDVSKIFHNVNANFSKTYRMTYGYSNKQNIFSSSPYYSSISSSWMLLYLGKLLPHLRS
ncbi:MAG: hypothetical protein HUK23_04050, partial [Sphaerochaetaceae bacterium]|nr:hypothetical protein [Sphaerochaetaceae bacterium]